MVLRRLVLKKYMCILWYLVPFLHLLIRITSIVEQKVAMETSMQSKEDNELWTAYVDDLWSTALPHLRDEGLYACMYVRMYVCLYVRMYVCMYV